MPARFHRLTLFEHQSILYSDLPGLPAAPAQRERALDLLARLNLPGQPPVLRLERKGLRALDQVGVIQVGSLQIEILPKLDAPDVQSAPGSQTGRPLDQVSETGRRSAVHNLLVMLSYTDQVRLQPREVAGLQDTPAPWPELLSGLFARGLYQEILAGLSQDYVAQHERLPVLRGRWDIQRQMLRQALDQPNFEVDYDERSPDIPLNQVLRAAVERLAGLSQDARTRQLLADLQEWFRPVRLLESFPSEFLESITFNRLNERFEPAYQLARLFLSGRATLLRHGPLPAYAFTFDMNHLFERFVAAFIERHRAQILPEHWPTVAIRPQSVGMRVFLGRSAGQHVIRLRPDLLFQVREEPSPRLIADTKYKPLDPSAPSLNVAAEDAYQMLAYAARFNCPRVLLLYPQAGPQPLRQHIDIPASAVRLSACTLNLRAPLEPPGALIEELRSIFEFAA